MNSALLLSAALAYPGFTLLCASMSRHQRQLLGSRVVPRHYKTMLQAFGWLLLSASLLPAVHVSNVGIGLVAWTGALSIAAAPLTLGLAYAPRAVGLFGPGLSLVGAGLALIS